MKKILLACSVLAVFSGAAFAADMPAPPPAYAPVYKAPPPAPTFSGCYIDGGVGYGVSNIDHNGETIPGLVPTSSSTTSGGRGWLGRAGGGCDYQFTLLNTWPAVIGLLADYDFSNISGTTADPTSGFGGNLNQSGAWYAGARAGVLPLPSLLTYVDGGFTELLSLAYRLDEHSVIDFDNTAAVIGDKVQVRFNAQLLDPLHLLASPRLWWGLLAASVMIAVAIRLRRLRDDA